MKNNKKILKRGFTLSEILVVVLIISVLAAVVYPLYTKSVTKSRAVEAINLLEMVRNKQIQRFAREGEYYSSFSSMGQLTSNKDKEVLFGAGEQLKVKDYTLSLNNSTNCMNAQYRKGSTEFTFSTSYETAGLGCSGSICSSFGNIIGSAQSVCNCGKKTCDNGFTLNAVTCDCDCAMSCNQDGRCYEPSGGGVSRPCSGGCGTETAISTCNGLDWHGSCWSPTKAKESQPCGSKGTQTRTCKAACSGEDCTAWGQCVGQQCVGEKPSTTKACGKCGTQTQSVDCDDKTGLWSPGGFGTCTGEGICSPGETAECGNEGSKTCGDSCGWGTCEGEKIDCEGSNSQACGNCGTQTRTCDRTSGKWNTWGECVGEKECAIGATETCGDGKGVKLCSDTCGWNTCTCNEGYSWDGTTCIESKKECSLETKPEESQPCGDRCGTQTRTVSCDTATGVWTPGEWSECGSEGECKPKGVKRCSTYDDPPYRVCLPTCQWGPECKCRVGAFKSCSKIDFIIKNYVETCLEGNIWSDCHCLPPEKWDESRQQCVKTANPTEHMGYIHLVFTPTEIYWRPPSHVFSCKQLESKTYYIDSGDLIYNSAGYLPGGYYRFTRGYYKGWRGGKKVSVSTFPSQYASLSTQEKCNRVCADGYGGSGWYYLGMDTGTPTSSSPVYAVEPNGATRPPYNYMNGQSLCEDAKGYQRIISCGC